MSELRQVCEDTYEDFGDYHQFSNNCQDYSNRLLAALRARWPDFREFARRENVEHLPPAGSRDMPWEEGGFSCRGVSCPMATRCGDTQLDWTLFPADEMAPRAMTPPASTILTLHAASKDATRKTPPTPL